MASETMKLQSKYIYMNAKQRISLQCYVMFEETTHKDVWVQKSFF